MKKIFLTIAITLLHFQLYAQVEYEKGYFIDNNGNRTECLILNKDWRYNPSEFTYKLHENSEANRAGIEQVEEFGIGDYLKYRKFLAAIDKSTERVGRLGTSPEPRFERERVFLKQLVEGPADLYMYRGNEVERFFYGTKNGKTEPLIYKQYRTEGGIKSNNRYRQQLFTQFSCEDIAVEDVRNLDYSRRDLVEFFEKYNSCMDADYVVYQEEREKVEVNVYLKGGVDYSTMSIIKGRNAEGAELTLDPSIRVGAEAEFIMPFNRNKWAFFIEPVYNSHTVDRERFGAPGSTSESFLTIDLEFISTNIGLRHYFFLNNSSKLFLNGAVGFDTPLHTHILFERSESYILDPELHELTPELYFSIGAGFNYSDRVSAEIRYGLPKNTKGSRFLESHYSFDWHAQVSSLSVLLAYRIF